MIKTLGYGLERPDPVFLILSPNAGRDAGEYYMQRLRWIEAEESDAISWDMRPLPGASGGRALYIARDYGWADRYLAFREEILPAGNYRLGVRLAAGGEDSINGSVEFSVVVRDERGVARNVATQEIFANNIEKDELKTHWVDFYLESGALVHPLLHFKGSDEYWIDGAELKGLDHTFDAYFHTFCKATLRAGEAHMSGGASPKPGTMTPEGKLHIAGVNNEELKLEWDAPAALQPGIYALFSHIQIESNQHNQIPWAELYAVHDGNRTKMITLYYDNTQFGGSGDQLQLNRVKIPSCESIELVVSKPADASLIFDQLLFLNLR